ncbi:MAG: extracellular solute-binding protein, partial [Bacillota bacterium]|nr:extracellular solute-binding protein [Bacillota bacterium]
MKQFSRRIFSVALCATLASQLLTGCASKDNARNTSTDTSAPEKITYPLCTDGSLSLTIWKRFGGSKYLKSDAENEAVQALMKATGVNLKFIHPAAGQATESFNLMVVSDNVADIMVDHAYTGGTIKGIDDGVFQELTNLVPKYMPNYNKILKDDFEFRRETTAEDGRIFSLFSYTDVGNGAVKDDKRVQAEWSRMQLRGDWLQEFGMDVPKTLDQYEAYFQKVLEKKPGVAPFTLASSGLNKQILGAYDLDNDFYIKKDGKVAWPEIQPEFKDYLTKMNDWYKKGYISQDFTSANPSKLFAASKTACYLDASNSAYNAGKSLNFKPTTAPYPRLQDGQQIRNGYFNWPETIDDKTTISAKSKHIKEALEFMDFSFDKENYKILAYGPKGVSWNPGPNG